MKTRSPDLFRKGIDQKNFLLYQQVTELLADRKSVKYFFCFEFPVILESGGEKKK